MRIPVGPLLRLVLSLGIFAAGFTPRLALCLGSDGHRAIESLDASCCQPGGTSSPGMADPCARTCTDLPLSLAVSVFPPERGGLHIDLSTTAIPVGIFPSMVPTSILARLRHTSAPSPGVGQRLRSIVLVC